RRVVWSATPVPHTLLPCFGSDLGLSSWSPTAVSPGLGQGPPERLPAGCSPCRAVHQAAWETCQGVLGLAYLRAVDVKILQQLVVVNEGIEAVKWLLEERSTLTSRCSSLASSQYSLVESQAASRRGSWDSLQDPNDRLDSISVGSYLDTLADDMDEYSQTADRRCSHASIAQWHQRAQGEVLGRTISRASLLDVLISIIVFKASVHPG
uniref:Leucine rich adaptor protein 1 n=1 Tax=Buteo japonicus TaxID=224669 RepID=A0A8B9Z6J3_9AVES